MARRPKMLRRRDHSGLYMLLVCGAVITALLFGLSMLGASSPDQELVEAETPAATTPEETTTEEMKEETTEETKEETTRAEKVAPERTGEEAGEAAQQRAEARQKKAERQRAAAQQEAMAQVSAPAPASPEMYLTVPKMGLTDDYVTNSVDEATLMNGAGHVPQTGFPWQSGANTYIASHVLGYEGTGSYLHFAELPNVAYGDEIFLSDANGTRYEYEVYEILQVSIYETWVMDPVGSDVVSLQTCINPPAYDVRLVVRGKLVNTVPA